MLYVLNKVWKTHAFIWKVEIFAAWRLIYFNNDNLFCCLEFAEPLPLFISIEILSSQIFSWVCFYNDLSSDSNGSFFTEF